MSKAFLVCVALILCLPPMAAEEAGTSSQQSIVDAAADQACLDAVAYLANNQYGQSDKPLSAMASAHVRRCNGHPDKIICETASRVIRQEYGKTPFTCGSDTADYSMPLILPPDNPPPPR
jgi:hypothetical protein